MQIPHSTVLKRVHHFLRTEKLTLSIAESCTGGLIASMLVDLPGASDFLDSGIVTYSEESKIDLLSVRKSTLKKYGAVSEETARQMAVNIKRLRKTACALSATGNLGPTALDNKNIGLVYFAVATEDDVFSKGMRFTGTRKQIKKQAALYGLKFLCQVLAL